MGLGTSIVVFAIGAVLRFATTVHSASFNVHTIGVIMMAVGVVGFVLSLSHLLVIVGWHRWHPSQPAQRLRRSRRHGGRGSSHQHLLVQPSCGEPPRCGFDADARLFPSPRREGPGVGLFIGRMQGQLVGVHRSEGPLHPPQPLAVRGPRPRCASAG